MVQKEKQRERSTDLSDISDSISSGGGRSVSQGSLPKRLYSAIMKKGDAKEGLIAGFSGSLLSAIAGSVIPIVPGFVALTLGFIGSGAIMGKLFPDGEFSTMGGVAVASTFMLLLTVGGALPLGLGVLFALLYAAVVTGGATAVHQLVSEDNSRY